MSGYGFGKKPTGSAGANTGAGEGAGEPERLDLSGIVRAPVQLDPEREEAAIRRGDALGFVDRDAASSATGEMSGDTAPRRRRRSAQPQVSVFIKGPRRRSTGSSNTPTSAATAPTGKRSRSSARWWRGSSARHPVLGVTLKDGAGGVG